MPLIYKLDLPYASVSRAPSASLSRLDPLLGLSGSLLPLSPIKRTHAHTHRHQYVALSAMLQCVTQLQPYLLQGLLLTIFFFEEWSELEQVFSLSLGSAVR